MEQAKGRSRGLLGARRRQLLLTNQPPFLSLSSINPFTLHRCLTQSFLALTPFRSWNDTGTAGYIGSHEVMLLMMVLAKGFEKGWVVPQGLQTREERRGVKEQARGIHECEIFISRVKLTHTPPHSFYQGAWSGPVIIWDQQCGSVHVGK